MRILLFAFAGLVAALAPLQGRAEDVAGDFDFYVLALSWSPTYCAIEASADDAQCGVERHGFILHGLWPQYEKGYPEYCRSDLSTRVSGATERSILDVMPSVGLIRYQWRKHGICTGLEQDEYFDLARAAYEKIAVPEEFSAPEKDRVREPRAIERAFVDANPGLSTGGIAVSCKQRHLADIRICLTRDLAFRSCPEVDADSCRSSRIDVPAVE